MEESKDRISSLPDDIIDHILFFLDMKYVVRTSLLSRRWKDTWTSVSTLHIDTRKFMSSETKEVLPFVRFVDRVLMYRDKASTMEMFDLYWDNKSNEIATYLNTWIIVALKRNVKQLCIEIEYNQNLTFRLPHRLFNSSPLTSLTLDFNGSRVVLPHSMCLPQLKQLNLGYIRIDDVKLLNNLLSSCPVLEDLILRDIVASSADSVSVIESSQLRHLEIVSCNMAKIFKLSTPSLESFICTDYMIQEYSLGNLPSLVTASIDMVIKKIEAEEEGDSIEEKLYPERMTKYLTALNNVEKLTLLCDTFQVLSESPDLIDSPLQFHNLRYLKLDMCFTRSCLRAFTYLLQISPNLESIYLITSKESNVGEDGEVGLPPCGLSHLKYIEIRGIKACDSELKFLGLVLKEAVFFKEMDLYFSNPEGSSNATESPDRLMLIKKFRRKLSALPRVSSCSILLVC